MNFKIKTIFAAGLAVIAASCTDLNVPVESQYTEYPTSVEAVEAKMANVYYAMRGCFGRRYMEAMCTSADEHTAITFSGNWVDGYAYINPSLHNYTYEDASIDWMGDPGRAIVMANEVIDADGDEKYVIPARAMRAFFTFIIMECWGDAPITDQKYCTEHNLDIRNRQPRAEVAKYLESELLAIADKLPDDSLLDDEGNLIYGKPNKWMAKALLAKIYLNWAVYTAANVADYNPSATNEKLAACEAICNEFIANPDYELGPDPYRFKFSYDNTERAIGGSVKDFIYVMPYETNEAQGMQWVRSRAYKDIKNMNPTYFGEKFSQSGGGYLTLIPEVAERFNIPGDERNLMILGHNLEGKLTDEGPAYIYDKETLLPTKEIAKDKNGNDLYLTRTITLTSPNNEQIDVGDNLNGWRQGYRSVKWFAKASDYNNGRNLSNDIPIFRYADILLTKAEVLVRQGKGGAKELMNEIRRYVGIQDPYLFTSEPTLEDIYEERGREFFDEIWRRNDMIRFGHFEDEYGFKRTGFPRANFDPRHRVFPVSKNDLDINNTWTQNAGY
ncbi:MAG: RagB/SusD family nutrient uptake outer membrane protein [Muribaculaceae bacterium]|nr:RagB/SusD family nutrient uptake outer membrane protein [Muribaculaceae bacterium]